MTRIEAIKEACSIVSLAYHSIGNYSLPSDGFCARCAEFMSGNYQNAGHALDYVRLAVVAKLKADGYEIEGSFDPETGKEKIKEQINENL